MNELEVEERRRALASELGEDVTVDGLSATYRIFQRRRGHRHSTDDLLTAWYAVEKCSPGAFLDLGTGIGTVGLLVVAATGAAMTGIEAQAISFRLLEENVRLNGLGDRVRRLHGDLRDLALEERFPLVTGSPPYFPASAGIVPSDSQKAHARFELRGDVRDYARAARRHLTGDGLFVFCFPSPQKARAIDAAHAEGFAIVARQDVVPREGLAPLFTLFACRPGTFDEVEELPFVVRTASGEHTEALRAVRRRFGWP